MDKVDIIVLSVVLLYLGYRIYQKYVKKDISGGADKNTKSSDIPAGDDYEPYSGK